MIADDYERLTLEEQKILLYLLDKNKITRKEAAELLNIGKSKTFEILTSLLGQKYVSREGKGRSTFYTLKNGSGDE